jgi:hypothetical protein
MKASRRKKEIGWQVIVFSLRFGILCKECYDNKRFNGNDN